jgi:predicted nucleic-acid-binding protein
LKGLDTNVLVRYLTQDHAAQSRVANELVEKTASRGDRLAISAIVLSELVWVLRSAYGLRKVDVLAALEKILDVAQLTIEDKDAARLALEDYRKGRGDFSDYLIGRRNRKQGCEATVTFDARLAGSELFDQLG